MLSWQESEKDCVCECGDFFFIFFFFFFFLGGGVFMDFSCYIGNRELG